MTGRARRSRRVTSSSAAIRRVWFFSHWPDHNATCARRRAAPGPRRRGSRRRGALGRGGQRRGHGLVTQTNPIAFETRGASAAITIDRPEARNAVNPEVAQGLEAAIDRLEEDAALQVGVLTSTSPVSRAGADLKAIG